MIKKNLVLAGGVLVVAALLLGACAQPNAEQGTASGGSAITVAPTTSAPTPSTADQPRDQIKVAATGTVEQGVEPGCLILDTGKGQRYTLLAKDKTKLKPGAKVQVIGVRAPGQVTYCQQGQPLEVQSVKTVS